MRRFYLLGQFPQLSTHRQPPNALTPTGLSYLARIAILMTILLTIFACGFFLPGDASGLSPVTGLYPPNKSNTWSTTPHFRWDAVAGEGKYQIQIASSEAALDTSPTIEVRGAGYTPASALTNLQTYYWRVRVVDGWRQAGAWSKTQTFQVNWGVLSILMPADGSSTADTTPLFRWDTVANAAKYQIQIADSTAALEGSPMVEVRDNTSWYTDYTPASALTNLQTHYWRVRAVDGEGQAGAWSGASFRVEAGAVSGLSPDDGSTTTTTTPTFSWDAVDGTAMYQIQIADTTEALEGSPAVEVSDTSYTPASALTNLQMHYWRVRAVGEEQAGNWSTAYSLRVEWGAVSGLSPDDGSSTTTTTPTFSWDAVDGAAKYQIQIADSESALEGSPAVAVSDTSYTPASALTNLQTHYWRVRAVGEGQAGNWSTAYSLRVEWGAVSGLSPDDGSSTTTTTPTFSWDAVDGAAMYQIQIAGRESALGGSPLIDEEVSDTSYTPTAALANLQKHYWRVRAVDGEEQAGGWSETQTVQVTWGTVSGLPDDGSRTTTTTPTFSWGAVDGAAKYQIQIADSESALVGNSLTVDEEVSGTSYKPASALTNLQTHHWRVRAVDGEGQAGGWRRSFLWVDWGRISGLTPDDGSSTTDTKPEFSWDAVAGAAKYEIQIAYIELVPASNPTVEVSDTSYTPESALEFKYYQTFHWRVRAMDANGQRGDWSGTSLGVGISNGQLVARPRSYHSFSILGTGPAGGIVFYDKGSYSDDGWRYLEAAPFDPYAFVEWGGAGIEVGGTSGDIGTGKANTDKIVAKLGDNNGIDYAAKKCSDLKRGVYSDWFLPSIGELHELYEQRTAVGGFSDGKFYWSSTEDLPPTGAYVHTSDGSYGRGSIGTSNKVSEFRFRAVRAF